MSKIWGEIMEALRPVTSSVNHLRSVYSSMTAVMDVQISEMQTLFSSMMIGA